MPTTTGIATEFITFTRASNATLTDSDGKVKWAPHNLLTNSESFNAASWTKSSVTPTANSIAAPNGTTTADTLAASGANGTTLQTFTAEAVSYTFAVWLKRKTGTGTIEIAADSGTYTAVTITSDWALYTVTQTPTAGSKTAGIRIVTSADEVYAWGASLYRSDLGGMQPNTSAYPLYNPTTPKNLLGYTESFDNAAWSKTNTGSSNPVVTANVAIGPNGLQTADQIVFPTTTSGQVSKLFQIGPSLTGTQTLSIYLRGASGGEVVYLIGYNGASYFTTTCTLTTSWQRFSAASTANGTTYLQLGQETAAGTGGMSACTIYAWGAQLSDSASLDPYVPVYGAAVTSAAYYGPRRDFDPVTLACKGLLVEEQRANLIRYSRTLETTASYWGGLASGTANTITIDNAAGPDGLSTSASMITYNTAVTGAGTYSAWRHTLSTTANGTYTFTIWLKAGTTSSVYLRFSDSGGNRANTLCTLTSSWQRFTVTGTTAASITTISCDVGADGNAGGQTLTAGTVYAYGAQLELGGFATSYVPNGSAVAGATRNADVASVSTQAFPYSDTAGTFVVWASATQKAGVYSDALITENIQIAAANTEWRAYNGTTNGYLASLGAVSDGVAAKIAVAYTSGTSASGGLINGGTVATFTSPQNTSTIMRIGGPSAAGGSPNYLNGHIRQITYLPRRVSNAELVTRST